MIILAYISKISQWHNYYKIYFSAMLTIYMSITIIKEKEQETKFQ